MAGGLIRVLVLRQGTGGLTITESSSVQSSETPSNGQAALRGWSPPVRVRAGAQLPESAAYRLKRLLLGPPLISDELTGQRLGKPTALAVLSSDVMSSSAYASEEILRILVPVAGLAAFGLVTPITLLILAVLGGRDGLLPGSGQVVPESGRLLRRQPGQLRTQRGPDRGRGAADQLHDHRRRFGGGR